MISVIINVYNGEKYIKKCLDIITNQTYKNIEILIVNDGSTDKTLEIIKKYKDKRIRVISQKNMGLSMSRNIGIDNASGNYLYFIDVDDLIELDTLEYLYNICQNYNVDIATCRCQEITDYNFKKKKQKDHVKLISSKKLLKMILLDEVGAVALWNKLIKKELFNNLRFENRIINDMNFTHKLILKTDLIGYGNQIKYYYLKRNDGLSNNKSSERLIDYIDVALKRYNYINNIYPKLISNKAGILKMIVRYDNKDDKKLKEYLKKQDIQSIYKKIFTFKIFFCRIGLREKVKIILYRISPKLNRSIINFYLQIKHYFKKVLSIK